MAIKQETASRVKEWRGVIHGQPYSKANSRRIVTMNGRPVSIKSKEAIRYVADFQKQCPTLDPLFEGDVCVEITIYYASRRPDLDESVILDAMQGRIYRNDRQVRRKIIQGDIDRDRPRAEIRVSPLD